MEQEQEEDLNLERLEKSLIIKALNKFNSKKKAYEALGMNERTFFRKLKEYKIVKYAVVYQYGEASGRPDESVV